MSLKMVTAKLNHTEFWVFPDLCLREYCIVTGLLGLATPTDGWGEQHVFMGTFLHTHLDLNLSI